METMKPFGSKWETGLNKPVKAANGLKHYPSESQICICCGKHTPKPKFMAVVNIETSMYTSRAEVLTSKFDWNAYPVGSECAKTLKAAGIPLYAPEDIS